MGIQPTNTYAASSLIVRPSQQWHISAADSAMFAESAPRIADRATLSKDARDRAAEAPTSGALYDFTNMSPNDILPTINSLIQSGHMSLDESSHLLLLVPITIGSHTAPDTLNQKVNVLSALEDWIAFHRSIQNENGIIYAQKALSALKRIQASHPTGG